MKALRFVCLAGGLLAQTPEQVEFFEKKVRPVLVKNCQACHNPRVKTAGLDLSTAEGITQGGASGPLTSKEDPESSLLLKVVSYDERLKMPPSGKLPDETRAELAAWVKMGAPLPGGSARTAMSGVRSGGRNFSDDERNFWSFQPVRRPEVPRDGDGWAHNEIDRFLYARLAAKGLKPAAPAGKVTWLRRATFDLTGLPPTEQEIAAFVADSSGSAYETVVNRLLASPRYGERWGRHWLDVSRYADSTGNDEDHRYPYAWRYRDYVIDSFNGDVPYNRFVREQIAGDLIPDPDGHINKRGIVATGFLALGAKAIAQQDKQKMLYDVYDEQLDVMSKAILGLTLSCGRCHDHKFDPLLQKDYYSIINFFANTKSFRDPETHVSKLLYTPLVPAAEYKKYKDHQDAIAAKRLAVEDVVEKEKERYNGIVAPQLAEYMLAARAVKAGSPAAGKGLDEKVLAKWVEYLKQDWRQKPHLEAWSNAASDAAAAEAAATYRKGFLAQMEKWAAKLASWRERTRRMLAEMNMPPPPKPEFAAEEDGFFYDVYIDPKGPFAVTEKDEERVFTAEAKVEIARLKQEHEELKKNALPEPDMACSVEEGDKAVAQKVFIRGDYASLGEDAPRGFPLILTKPGDPVPPASGSGRLALADWLASPENPLTARVMVNRIWQHHFGEGIVRSPDNFGKMGERPAHPELLDYLAAEFVAGNWSVKRMHRLIMLSAAYRMSSDGSAEAVAKDPENRLFSRFNRRRLSVEEIRDGLLAVDGSIDLTMGGTLQAGFGTDGENSQDRLSVRPDDYQRRTVYLPLRRANLPALLNLFDFGDATSSNGVRTRTNVASQALFMLNSDFLSVRSRNIARQLLADASLTPAKRMERAYLKTVNRAPAPEDIDAGLTYIGQFRSKWTGSDAEAESWQSMVRVLMASNDFIYVD
jgi:hypothetical protein